MFQCLIQFHDGQNVFPPSGSQHCLRLHTLHDSFKAIREAFLDNGDYTHTALIFSSHMCSYYSFYPLICMFASPSLQPSIFSFFLFFFFLLSHALHCPLFIIAIVAWLLPFSDHLSLFFPTQTVSTVCIKRPVIHHRVRAECSPCCTPVCRLLVCQQSRARINHPNLRH